MTKTAPLYTFTKREGPVRAHRHPNGKGWVADTATVTLNSYVGPNAVVYGLATVENGSRVYGNARIGGYASVSMSEVHGKAMVFGKARVCRECRISGNAKIYGRAHVQHSTVRGKVVLCGKSNICFQMLTGTQRHPAPRLLLNVNAMRFPGSPTPVPAHQHPNGGGWVADTAHVDRSCYVGPQAMVFGNAQVVGNVSLHDCAKVYGYAYMGENCVAHNFAEITGRSLVSGNAVIAGSALIGGNAIVTGTAIVRESAIAIDQAMLSSGIVGGYTIINR